MKLIEKIGSKPESKNSTKTKQFGLFECPVCKEHVEKPLSHGRKNKTCGNRECRKATFINTKSDTSSYRKDPIISTLPYYSSISSYHNRLINSKYIQLSDELMELRNFITITYSSYATLREMYPQIPLSIVTTDGKSLITKDNYKFIASQDELVTPDLFINEFVYCCRRLMYELDVTYAVANQAIKTVTSNYSEKQLVTKFGNSLKTLIVNSDEYNKAYARIKHNKNRSKSDTLYMIKCADHIKIGITNDVNKRLTSIRTSTPFEVTLVASWKFCENSVYSIEQYIHKKYKDSNVKLEWFKLTEKQVLEIVSSLSNDKLVKELAGAEAKSHAAKMDSLLSANKKLIQDKINTYEQQKADAREANKKPVIETVHEDDERFAHDRTNQIKATTTHGMSHTELYKAWQTMKKTYGVCADWEDFRGFQEIVAEEFAELEESMLTKRDVPRVYPIDTECLVGPQNYQIKRVKDHKVKSAVARAVLQLKDGEVIAEHSSVTDAAKAVNGLASKISAVCKGKRKTHAGFAWEYKE